MANVKNILRHQHSDVPHGFDSWKDFWERRTNRQFASCSRVDCFNKASIGMPVRHEHIAYPVYVIPLCVHCSHPSNGDTYEIVDRNLVKL